MKTYTRRRPIYSTRIPRHGEAKQQEQLIQRLKRRGRSRFQDQDAFPRVALFTEASIHAYWNHAHRKPNRRLLHATTIIIMTGHDEMTVHCQASLTTINQRHRYPDDNTGRPRQRHVTSKAYQVRYQRFKKHIRSFSYIEKTSHSHREGAS